MHRLLRIVISVYFSLVTSAAFPDTAPLRFVAIEVGAPYGYTLENGKEVGILYEVLEHLGLDLGLPYSLYLIPYKRMLYGLKTGEYDCSIFFNSPERNLIYHQIGLITQKPIIIISLTPTEHINSAPISLKDFEGKTVGQIRAAHYGDAFDKNSRIKKREFDNYKQAINLVEQKRLDALIGPKEMILDMFDFKQEYFVVKTNEIWLQCSKKSARLNQPGILDKINSAQKRLHHLDEVQDAITLKHRKYLKNYIRPQ